MAKYKGRSKSNQIGAPVDKITLDYSIATQWMHLKFYDEQLIFTFGTDEERSKLSDYISRIKNVVGSFKVVKSWSADHRTFEVTLQNESGNLAFPKTIEEYQALCSEFKSFTDDLGDKYFPVFRDYLNDHVSLYYEGFVIPHDKDKNADDIINPSPEKRHYHLVCHLHQSVKKSDPRVSIKLNQMVNANGKYAIIKYRFGFDSDGNSYPDNPILTNSDKDRQDISPVRALREMLAYLVHNSAISNNAVGKHAYSYDELYGFGCGTDGHYESGYCHYDEVLAFDPLGDRSASSKHKKEPNAVLTRYLNLVDGFDPNSDRFWDQSTVQHYNEMALEWANSFLRFDKEIRKYASVSEMTNNSQVIKEIQTRYEMAVRDKLNSMNEKPRLCVFIQTPPDFGKSTTLDLCLADLGYNKEQVLYKTGSARYGSNDLLDPYYRVIVFDDAGMSDPLTLCDNKPNRSVGQKRGKGFAYYCPDIVVIMSNLNLTQYASEMTNLYHNSDHHDDKLFEAFRSRLYACHIESFDDGSRELVVDSKCTRGDINAIEVSVMFRRFKEMFNTHIGYYDPGFTDEEVIDRVDGDLDTYRYFMQCFDMKEDKLVDFLFENHDQTVQLPPYVDPDLFSYLVNRLFTRLIPRLKASGNYDRLDSISSHD